MSSLKMTRKRWLILAGLAIDHKQRVVIQRADERSPKASAFARKHPTPIPWNGIYLDTLFLIENGLLIESTIENYGSQDEYTISPEGLAFLTSDKDGIAEYERAKQVLASIAQKQGERL